MYALVENQMVIRYPYTLDQFRDSHPNTSFPVNISDDELTNYGVVRVIVTGQPIYDQLTQNCVESTPSLVNGRWLQTWSVVAASEDEINQRKQEIKNIIIQRTQQRLDSFAQTRNYDNILSAATYVTSTVPKFQVEGQYAVEARDNTWKKLYEILTEVESGARPVPKSYEEIEPELPVLQWPNE